jgi:type I restriction enzyme S subunit
MIADIKPYTRYKESGLPWVEHVPVHWDLVPNRGLVRRRKMLVGERHTEYELLSLTKQGVIVRDVSKGKGKFSADLGTSQQVRDGDLVFCLFDVPETPRTVGLSRHNGMITGAYTVFESLGRGSSEYFELFYRAMDDRKILSPMYSGLRNTIPVARFLGTKTPIPPLVEQEAIVRFFVWANDRLERVIRSKRKVITLLNEQKQAIIHRAVTRGLDPKVPLKPSGVPWLGDIPVHWELRRLKSVLLRNDGGVWGTDFTPEGTTVLRSTEQAMDGSWQISEPAVIRLSESQFNSAVLYTGDIVVTKSSGSASHIGKASLVTSEIAEMKCCYSNFMQRLRTTSELEPKYLHIFLNSQTGRSHYHYTATSTTGLGNLTRETIATLQIPLPSRPEQVQILNALRERITPLDSSISRLEREIELLSEYRSRLIADVVTGKLDVREAVTRLPDDISRDTTNDEDLGDETEMPDQENGK